MKTIEIKLYKFEELSKEAQQKAIEGLSSINVNHNWYEDTKEDAKNIGLQIDSFDLDRNRHATGNFLLSPLEVAQNILNEHGETCETYKTAKNFLDAHAPVFSEYMNEQSEKYESQESEDILQELEDNFLSDILDDYSIILQNESEYLQSEEAVIETIQANEYDFTIDGKLY